MNFVELTEELKEFKLLYDISKDNIVFHAKLMEDNSVYDITWLSIIDNERKYVRYTKEVVDFALSNGL